MKFNSFDNILVEKHILGSAENRLHWIRMGIQSFWHRQHPGYRVCEMVHSHIRRLHHIFWRKSQILCVRKCDFSLDNELSIFPVRFVFRLLLSFSTSTLSTACISAWKAKFFFLFGIFHFQLRELSGDCWSVKMQWL